MNSLVKLCLCVLKGNIVLNNKIVPVIKRGYPLDKSPCITLDDSGGTSLLSKELDNIMLEITSEHQQYDETKEENIIPQEVLISKYSAIVNVNVWCDTENDRETIDNQVKTLFNKAFTNHYLFCSNYDKENTECKFLGSKCPATIHFLGKSAKKQCPKPFDYNYEDLFKRLEIDKTTFSVDEPFSMDELNTTPRILRSIHRVRGNYWVTYVIGGNYLTKINVTDDLGNE